MWKLSLPWEEFTARLGRLPIFAGDVYRDIMQSERLPQDELGDEGQPRRCYPCALAHLTANFR
jgi:hypothetical protein